MKIPRGIIVSIQGYSKETTQELADEVTSAGAVALRLDKPVYTKLPIIGLQKIKVKDIFKNAYITPTIEDIKKVVEWSDFVAIDYRYINKNLPGISDFCRKEKINVVADIRGRRDWINIKNNDLYFTYISTTFSIFDYSRKPNVKIIEEINKVNPGKVIAEGGYHSAGMVISAYNNGATSVCIGESITGVYKLAKRFTKIDPDRKKE